MYNAFARITLKLDILYRKIENIRKYEFASLDYKLACTLPEKTELNLNIIICFDGYNAGSIIDENTMCLDILFWLSEKENENQIEGVILHEFHHIGLLYWLNKNERRKTHFGKQRLFLIGVKPCGKYFWTDS